MAERVVSAPVRPVATEVAVNTPVDRVRWTSVIAGFFTVLCTIVILTILGIAIGLSTVDPNNPRGFALGASIYGGAVALLAFFFGGWIAARTAAVGGTGNGILNGAMVWIITIPILVYVLGNGIGSILGTAADLTTKAATIGVQAAPAVATVASQTGANTVPTAVNAVATPLAGANGATTGATQAATTIPEQAQAAVATVQNQIQDVTPQQIQQTAQSASSIAWTTLLALALSAAAALFGGLAGARTYPNNVVVRR
jgi:hypothetical protein